MAGFPLFNAAPQCWKVRVDLDMSRGSGCLDTPAGSTYRLSLSLYIYIWCTIALSDTRVPVYKPGNMLLLGRSLSQVSDREAKPQSVRTTALLTPTKIRQVTYYFTTSFRGYCFSICLDLHHIIINYTNPRCIGEKTVSKSLGWSQQNSCKNPIISVWRYIDHKSIR